MKQPFKLLLIIALFLGVQRLSYAQCASFSYSIGTNNQVTFFGIATGTNAASTFTWTFGAPNLSTYTATGNPGLQTTVTYSTPGTYTVTFASSSCTNGIATTIVVPTCSVSISTANASGTLCSGTASVSFIGFCGTPTIAWSNGGSTAFQSSLCAGFYSVMVTGSNPTCCPSGTASAFVNTVAPCAVNASFTHTVLANGNVSFSSTSTGTIPSSVYVWNYGDGSANGSGLTSNHTYTAVGNYLAKLTVINNSLTCFDTTNFVLISPQFCGLTASINTSFISGTNSYSFSALANGTSTNATYFWNFGDGNTATGANVTHSYSVANVYTVGLFVNNNSVPTCSIQTYAILNFTCNVVAAFTHTVGANGLVAFSNQSIASNTNSSYLWDFGDGYGDITANPFHQYSNAGMHYVKFKITSAINCSDSVVQALNITGVTCSATPLFSVTQGQSPSQWIATPSYPYNVSAALWNWGDGSTSNTLYASHVYSVAGNYSICLSVTVSCNATASYCYSQYFYKPAAGAASGPVYVNVEPPQLKLAVPEMAAAEKSVFLWPNPTSSLLHYSFSALDQPAEIKVLDVSGRTVYTALVNDLSGQLDLSALQRGLYFLTVNGQTKQIILENNR